MVMLMLMVVLLHKIGKPTSASRVNHLLTVLGVLTEVELLAAIRQNVRGDTALLSLRVFQHFVAHAAPVSALDVPVGLLLLEFVVKRSKLVILAREVLALNLLASLENG